MASIKGKQGICTGAFKQAKPLWNRQSPYKSARFRDPFDLRTVFGNGTYSQNIVAVHPYTHVTYTGTMSGGGGLSSAFNGTVEAYGSSCTPTANGGYGVAGWGNDVGVVFPTQVKLHKIVIKAPNNAGFLGTAAVACALRVLVSNNGVTWTTAWERAVSGGGVGEVVTADVSASPFIQYMKVDISGNGVNQPFLSDIVSYYVVQPYPLPVYYTYSADLAPSSTVTHNGTVNGGYVDSNLVDGNNSTGAGLTGALSTNAYMFDYGASTPREIRRITTSCNFGTAGNMTSYVGYSDDGTNWTEPGVSIVTATSSSFTTTDLSAYGKHRHWRLRSSGLESFQFTTITMHDYVANGGVSTYTADVTTDSALQATFQPVGTYQGGYEANKALDRNTTTFASANASATNALGFYFSTPRNVRQISITQYTTASYGCNARWQYSDDGAAWYDTNQTAISCPYTGSNYTSNFTINDYGAHKYWRLLTNTAATAFQLAEIYIYERVTVQNPIVITSAATAIVDPTTLASVVRGHSIVLDGAQAAITPEYKCYGLYYHLTGDIVAVNGATTNIDGLGRGGAILGDKSEVDVIPTSLRIGLAIGKLSGYKLKQPGGVGGTRGPASTASYNMYAVGGTGVAGVGLQTGGGGGGGSGKYAVSATGGLGGKGTAFIGGGGGGGCTRHDSGGYSGADADDNGGGGRGGGNTAGNGGGGGGGAGDPVGGTYPGDTTPGNPGTGAGGGVLISFIKGNVYVGSGSKVSADGKAGGNAHTTYGGGGGGAGGGILAIFYRGLYTNGGTVSANGGLGGNGGSETGNMAGGPGGAGGVLIQQI